MAHVRVNGNLSTSSLQSQMAKLWPPPGALAVAAAAAEMDYEMSGDADREDRNTTKNLTYPLDVESDPQQGHYIIFEIMRQDKTKLAGQKALRTIKEELNNVIAEAGGGPENAIAGSGAAAGDVGEYGGENLITVARGAGAAGVGAFRGTFETHTGPNSIQVAKDATVAMPVCIALYMPPSVQVSYGAKYGEQEIGVFAESVNAGIRAFMNETESGVMTQLAAGAGTAAGGFVSGGANWLKQKASTGTAAMFAINSGSIITPRMELMFEGITRRDFSFSFTFLPKSEQEAQVVHQIVHKFKYHMASNYGGLGMGGVDGVREMEIPDFFNIRYMYQGAINPHLNLIKQCVLKNANVEYGADRYKSYEGGVPQTTKLSLSFSELEIITKDYISQGY